MKTLKWLYKVVRSVIFTAVITVVVLFVFIYVAVSIPPVQGIIRDRIQKELSAFLGGEVMIRNITIHPMNEVIIEEARFFDLNNKECLRIDKLGAGINIWRLIFSQEIEVTYVELLDFKANIYQTKKDEPLNIDFIIKAFEPKDKNKPKTKFDLKIHNIVIRGGEASFSRLWMPGKDNDVFDSNHIEIQDLSADITIPRLSNDDVNLDLRRLSFFENSGFQLVDLSGKFSITQGSVSFKDLKLRLPETLLQISDNSIPLSLLKNIDNQVENKLDLKIYDSYITPSDLSAFYPPLAALNRHINLNVEVEGNRELILVEKLKLDMGSGFTIDLEGFAKNFLKKDQVEIDIQKLVTDINTENLTLLLSLIPANKNLKSIIDILEKISFLDLNLHGSYNASASQATLETDLSTAVGNLKLGGNLTLKKDIVEALIQLESDELTFSSILPQAGIESVKGTNLKLTGNINTKDFAASSGILDFTIDEINLFNRSLTSLQGQATAKENIYSAHVDIDDNDLNGDVDLFFKNDGEDSQWDLEAHIRDFDSYNSFIHNSPDQQFEISGYISAHGYGNSFDHLGGKVKLEDFSYYPLKGETFNMKEVDLEFKNIQGADNFIRLNSDIADFSMSGNYNLAGIPNMIKRTLWEICPSVFPHFDGEVNCGNGEFKLAVNDMDPFIEFFNIPVVPLTELNFEGKFDSSSDFIEFSTDIPYIQQGKNNLITGTYLRGEIQGSERRSHLSGGMVYPTKKGLLKIDLDIFGNEGDYNISVDLNRGRDVAFYGNVSLNLNIEKDPLSGEMEIVADWLPSNLRLNDTDWHIEEAKIEYDKEGVKINNFCIRHADQFIVINGNSDKRGDGEILLSLADINVDYIFETLNIPHVTFGGSATGKAVAKSIFSSNPDIHTEDFVIRDFSYNGAVLGVGDISGRFDLPAMKVALGAKIRNEEKQVAEVDGGVWVGRDSLSFRFKADDVNVGVVKPFMQAFSSDIKGTASGEALLYGTFSDIDMTGTLVAHNVEMLIDYINARYTANDTVFMTPGKITLPNFKVTDSFGNTAILNGEVNHRYFHDPTFTFTISDMESIMVYNTNPKINPLWYGKIFASGAGEITGKPGIVSIKADVVTDKGSDFTFVLSDQQEAVKSNFLTFSDKRKEAAEKAKIIEEPKDTVPDFLKKFRQQNNKKEEINTPDIFTMDIRASVTDNIKLNLIMDPIAGDKITAYGEGAMNMTYSSLTDELKLYGKYILEKGSYNFSLQDIILKDFTIKEGSSIAFTGDPYTGILDITAAYRVNTSLTELDKSFANDRDLNRTSVPVEALLNVTGPLTSPNISFDIDLPTVTEETAQKVRSIISTDDMMSRQVLYLVALNKFYPPEYMATSSSGGEWASIATSTISSQIQNMIGQITDKFTLAPSIKSDKGDFSDIEFDLGLSSQLFNNRLLINGNLGYRDPSNSSTTFIGDFDLEYLLNSKGTWRLKAYNHFNDQNYYLKSSLTTQGLGIVWRKDFGIPRKKEE